MKEIYLFPHIAKTGGAALCENVERAIPRGQSLRLNCTHRQWYFHPRTQKLCFYEKDEEYKELLASLNEEEKVNLAFASGHDLPYGFHEHFPQPAKYFLFVRNPIARTLSLYNYQRYQRDYLKNQKTLDESHRRLALFSDRFFLINQKVPSFEEWFETSYNGSYHFYFTMTRFLQEYGYLDKKIVESSLDRLFDKFFFVGLTESLDEDELFLYHEMGINRFWANRNASRPYVHFSHLSKALQEKIREIHQDDFTVYERARKINRDFKKNHQKFRHQVQQIKWQKRKGWIFEKLIPALKRLLRPILRKIRCR